MSKRNAIRLGNPDSPESVLFTLRRYGPIQPETLKEILEWLENHRDEYKFEVKEEAILDNEENETISFTTIKTQRIGSFIFKIIDNQHDAENSLANIRNENFPKEKKGQ